jgi:Homing endonuclease associated repeat
VNDRRKRRRAPSEWVKKKYSDEELLQLLREANEAIGGVMTASAYNAFAKGRNFADGRPWPTQQTHFHRFGSWRKALQAAGLEANPPSAIAGQCLFDLNQCIDAILHVHREVGAAPTISEYEAIATNSHGALPSSATVRNRCGSWSKALRLADLV